MPYGCEITVIVQEGLKIFNTSVLCKLIKVIVKVGLIPCILVQDSLFNY